MQDLSFLKILFAATHRQTNEHCNPRACTEGYNYYNTGGIINTLNFHLPHYFRGKPVEEAIGEKYVASFN